MDIHVYRCIYTSVCVHRVKEMKNLSFINILVESYLDFRFRFHSVVSSPDISMYLTYI